MDNPIRLAWRLKDGSCGAAYYSPEAADEAVRNIFAFDAAARVVRNGQLVRGVA